MEACASWPKTKTKKGGPSGDNGIETEIWYGSCAFMCGTLKVIKESRVNTQNLESKQKAATAEQTEAEVWKFGKRSAPKTEPHIGVSIPD